MRKKNATNSSAPLWSRVCSEWFGFHCEWQNHTMYSIDDTFWIIWIIWIFPNISYFLHLFHTASEIYPPSMSSQVTYNWKESSVRPCACNFVPRTASAAGRDEWKKRERERERTQPSEHEATREPFKMSCGPWTLCLSIIVPMQIN